MEVTNINPPRITTEPDLIYQQTNELRGVEKKSGESFQRTTVRDSVLKPACKVSNFAVKIDLWEKLNFTGRFSCHSSNCVPKEDSRLRSGPIA